MIKYIEQKYKGIIIIPMTLVIKSYYEEIIGKLKEDNVIVYHFILEASKLTIQKRLEEREKKKKLIIIGRKCRLRDAYRLFKRKLKE